jgi:two-component system phosphate regulon sensor histidine kinase PhoR
VSGGIFRRGFAFIAAAVLATAALVLSVGLAVSERAYIASNAEGLARAARAAAAAFGAMPAGPERAAGDAALASALAKDSGYRITLVDSAGRVAADTKAESSAMENHLDRPEIAGALAGEASWSRRRSATTGEWMLYAASPLRDAGGAVTGALRLSLPLPDLTQALGSAKTIFIFVAAAAALIALAASGAFVGAIARPVEALSERARRYAEGKRLPGAAMPDADIDGAGTDAARGLGAGAPAELRALASSLDAMGTELTRRAAEAKALGERYSEIVDSAAEAILALDADLRIVEANPAAHAMFGAMDGALLGLPVARLSGGAALADLASRCLAAGKPVSDDVALYAKAGTTLRASASPLGGGRRGVVLNATDISVMKRLETMRRDFVANVSHELRTPIHLIRGFAETLRSGPPGEDAAKYLEIIERNALRMERIVSDLLQLARLERDPADWLQLETCSLEEICVSATEAMQPQAAAKSVKIVADLEPGARLRANAGLVEQALVNLLENAIRYSPEGASVRLEGRTAGGFAEICVRDYGPGIPAPDLERIFERFYRADKSRDRRSGGTGLGLAIVRHIAMAHGGSASAESWAGEGSRFMLRLPLEGPSGETVDERHEQLK